MNPADQQTLELARRTRKNLEFIYKAKDQGEDVEEFTQLINSMLSMLISLREEYFRGTEVTWQDVQRLGLQPISIQGNPPSQISPLLKEVHSFSQLISKMRHAFSHNCFNLIGDPITALKLWNIPSRKDNKSKNRIWEAELTEQELKDVTYLFTDYIEKQHGSWK